MINFLITNKTAWIGFLVALVASFIMVANSYAQESPQEAAQKFGVTFPITELDGCTDYSACRRVCEDPLNADRCIKYGKKKGFYQEDKFEVRENVLQAAKRILGCDSKTSCLNLCEVPANQDKCDIFAEEQGLVGGRVDDPSKPQVINRAKEVLGCDSVDSCRSLCSRGENKQKCSKLADEVGLYGGEQRVGPGGCTSEQTCKALCSDPNNFQVCSGFNSVAGAKFTGPGGCDSEASCKSFCQSNEKACSNIFGGGPGSGGTIQTKYDPVDMCNRTPNCAWTGNSCQCGFYGETTETAQKSGEYAAYCRTNPDKCRPGQVGSFDTNSHRQEFENYCSQNPEKCKPSTSGPGGTPGDVFDPSTQCSRYGCTWSNNSCQCGGIRDYNPAEQCNSTPNCSWAGDHCQCGGTGTYSYPTPGAAYSYPTPYSGGYSYPTPYSGGTYSYPTPGGTYSYPTPYSGGTYSYPTPYSGGTYSYPTPYSGSTYSYPTPYSGGTYSYPTPYSGSYSYPTPYTYSYPTPHAYSYPTPQAYSYPTPQAYSYPTPQAYSYPTPQAYSYPTPQSYSYPTPAGVQGVSTRRQQSLFEQFLDWLRR